MSEPIINPPSWAVAGEALGAAARPLPMTDQVAALELITGEQLEKCAPSLSKQRAAIMAGLLNGLCPKYGIRTKDVLHEFLANVLQESLEFQHKVENMNYRAQTLADTWPSRCAKNKYKPYVPNDLAISLARKPKETAIAMYGSRMGNRPGTEDGWNLRGSGYIGLTGYFVIEAFRKFKGFATVEQAAAYCRDSDYGALDSALWFFCVLKNLMDEAERDEMIGIVKEINGGLIGLSDRQRYYDAVKKYVV
jgi:putative chitinase